MWAVHQLILMGRLFWCSEKEACSWDHKFVWALVWPFHCCVSLGKLGKLSVFLLHLWWDSYNVPHRLKGEWNGITLVIVLHKIWNSAQKRYKDDKRWQKGWFPLKCVQGQTCFLALLDSPGPTHLIWGRQLWRCVSSGLGVLRALRYNRNTWEGIQFRSFLYVDLD